MSESGPWQVLIVDDARLFRYLLRDGLRSRFPAVEVMQAENLAEGYRNAKESHPKLVLLDISLPDGNGLELARRIRDEVPGVIVCICTIHDYPEYRQAAADSGAACFISKQGTCWSDTENLIRRVFESESIG